jgi:hypothetical protein
MMCKSLKLKRTIGGQKIRLTTNEIHEIEDHIERFSKESESVTSTERIIRELEINGKSCRLKVIIEVQEDYFEDSFND